MDLIIVATWIIKKLSKEYCIINKIKINLIIIIKGIIKICIKRRKILIIKLNF